IVSPSVYASDRPQLACDCVAVFLTGTSVALPAPARHIPQRGQTEPFTDACSVDIPGDKLCANTSQPLQQPLAQGIHIAQVAEVNDESLRDYFSCDQEPCLLRPVTHKPALHLQRRTVRQPPNFCTKHCFILKAP